MHELGIVAQVVKVTRKHAEKNHLTEVDKIVLQVGEFCDAIPEYIEKVFPIAIFEKEGFENCKLEVEIIPAIARCEDCGKHYKVRETRGKCPECGSDKYLMKAGQELMIKEITAH